MCRGCREPNAHFTHRCAICHCLFISGTTRHYNAHAKGSRHQRRLPKLQLVDPQFVDPGVQPIDAPGRHPCAICRKSFDDGAWATHDASNAHQMNLRRLQRPQAKGGSLLSALKVSPRLICAHPMKLCTLQLLPGVGR